MIGTDREIETCAFSYCNEVRYMQKRLNTVIPFIIIDEGNAEVQARNKSIVSYILQNQKDIKLIYIDSLVQQLYFDLFKQFRISQEILDLLNFEGNSYGRILNKQFLIAATFGADYIHRRDSDTQLIANKKYPSEYEIKYLGRKISEIPNKELPQNISFDSEKRILMVGSGYSGGSDWKTDYTSLLPNDIKAIIELNQLLRVPDSLILVYLSEIISGINYVDEPFKFLPDNMHANPDFGNISFYNFHKFIPASPIHKTTGSDYFITYLLKNNSCPIIYHNHFVLHKYTNKRKNKDENYVREYWNKLTLMYDYYFTFYDYLIPQIKQTTFDVTDIENTDINLLINCMKNIKVNKKERYNRIMKISNIIAKSNTPIVKECSDLFKKDGFREMITSSVDNGIDDHIKLLAEWSNLIDCAKQINPAIFN